MSIEPLPPEAITLVESPEAQLAEAAAIREVVLGQSDLPGTYREYAKLTGVEEMLKQYKGKSDAALFEITLIRREAERKMGQMLLDIPRNPGARTDLTSSDGQTRLYEDVLKDLGLTQDRATRWQHAARCPEEQFRERVEVYRGTLQPITLEELVWVGREQTQLEERKQAQEEAERRARKRFCPRLRYSLSPYPHFQYLKSG
jgi:hypothetical protein